MKRSGMTLWASIVAAVILVVLMVISGIWLGSEDSAMAPEAASVNPNATASRVKMPSRPPRPLLKPLDVRDAVVQLKTLAANRLAEVEQMKNDIPGVQVSFDELTGSPSRIQATGRFLTGPAAAGMTPREIIESFIQRYPLVFGHGPAVMAQTRVQRDDKSSHGKMQTLVWNQEVEGIPLYRTTFQANLAANGEIITISSRLLASPRANTSTPTLSVAEAVSRAARVLGDTIPAASVKAQDQPKGRERKQKFQAQGISDTFALLTYFPMNDSEVRLGWDVTLASLARNEMHRVVVDAVTGEPLVRTNLTNTISNATYNVYGDATTIQPFDSPAPMSPSHQEPLTSQPPVVARQSVTTQALSTTASPNGWVADGANPETIGNNVAAHSDVTNDNIADLPRPNGGSGRNFNFAMDLAQAPSTYRSAAIVNLFYVNNWLHDKLYGYGFTESAGNFQTNNFGKGGSGSDAVLADAQDGGGFDNANFFTPADGSPGRMQMYLWDGPSPDRDGSFDAQIIVHEYVHGLSNRLVGGGLGIVEQVPRGMGEGWSDFYALALLSKPTSSEDDAVAMGGYSTFLLSDQETNYYFGIRRYPYSPDKSKNPLTFQDVNSFTARFHDGVPLSQRYTASNDDPSQVHRMGEIWCNTLMEVRRLLIKKHGYNTGNDLVLQLVTDGMKLSPVDPTFVEARDAIIQADLVLSGGTNAQELWAGFAKRGLGESAVTPANDDTDNVEEAYDAPGDMTMTPVIAFQSKATLGGSSTPAKQVYRLKNNGTTSLQWTASKTQPWTTVKPTSGTLGAGRTVEITWSLNSDIDALPPGEKHDILTITDTNTGATQARPLIFNLNAKPVITSQPLTALRAEGTSPSHTFTINFTGTKPMTFQWFKDDKRLFTTASSLNLGFPDLIDAGTYKAKLTNPAGTTTTTTAQLAVVNTASRVIPFNDGTTLTVNFPYKGKGLIFQWLRNGTPLTNGDLNRRVSGATSPTLKIARFTAADVAAGNLFQCQVNLGMLQLTTGNLEARVRDAPVLAAVAMPPTLMTSDYVSRPISNFITQTNNQVQHLPTSYTISGLPRGLTYDRKTGYITGYARVTGLTSVTLTIRATNAAGSGTVTVTVPFMSLPALAYGEFFGLINRSSTGNSNLGSLIQMNISNVGTITGKIRRGTKSLPLKFVSYDSSTTGSTFFASATAPSGLSTPLNVSLTITTTTGAITGTISGFVKGGYYSSSLTAKRAPWTNKTPSYLATDIEGAYTAHLVSTLSSEPTYPQGSYLLRGKLNSLGELAGAVRFADGTSYTYSTTVTGLGAAPMTCEVPLHISGYSNTGSLHGFATLNRTNGFLDGTPTFFKASQPTGSSTRSYKSGVPLHTVTLTGGPWVKPTSPTLLLGVTDTGSNNAKCDFTRAFINTSFLAPAGTYTAPFRIKSAPANSIGLPNPNPGGLSLSLNLTTGEFSGRFSTKDDNPVITGTQLLNRTAPYYGVIVQRLNQGHGHFNLAQLPSISQTNPNKTTILSGKVVISTPP
ncbi:MAG: M36 family metallopeptidase [Verrucomicrobiaceae bacterium]|nr:M36 family metallopeptidase [Verrucomicrobiaceae bacterium]